MPKALIVDDLEANRDMMKALLSGNDIDVTTAANGAQALELAKSDHPDIIISDILMPVMDGFALCHAWMKNPELSSIPFVFSTATYTEQKDEALGLSLGAIKYLIKPIDPDSFIGTIRSILEARAAGNLKAATPTIEEEVVYYRLYNEALIRRLEAKMLSLEELNKELDRRVASRTMHIERMRQDMEAFSYSVSHDLRAPLRAIIGFTDILKSTTAEHLSDEEKSLVTRIETSSQKMDKLISSLLDLSRITATPMKNQIVNMKSGAREAFTEAINGAGKDFEFDLQDIPESLGDPVLLHQVWFNLFSNAIKFTRNSPEKKISVGCSTSPVENVYWVKDTGIGFDPAYKDQLFHVFQRLHDARDFEGTGIGLALVHRIVSCLDGRTWADGIPGGGATFYFALPRSDH